MIECEHCCVGCKTLFKDASLRLSSTCMVFPPTSPTVVTQSYHQRHKEWSCHQVTLHSEEETSRRWCKWTLLKEMTVTRISSQGKDQMQLSAIRTQLTLAWIGKLLIHKWAAHTTTTIEQSPHLPTTILHCNRSPRRSQMLWLCNSAALN